MFALLIAAFQIAAPGEAAPTFEATGAADEPKTGRIVRLNADLSLVLTRAALETTTPDLISLRRSERPLPPPTTGPQLITTSGDRIAGKFLGGDDQSLRFLPAWIDKKKEELAWKVSQSSAAVLWLTPMPADTPTEPSQYDWLAANRNRDVFRFRNGDTDKGTLAGLNNEALFTFRPVQGAARSIRSDELAAVGFNPVLARTRKPKGPYARVILAEGSRLSVSSPTIESGELKGDTLFGTKVVIPVAEILSLDVLQGKAIYLSDVKPKKVEQSGYLGVAWPWMADRNAQGNFLRVATADGEATFDKGLGTHPQTVLTYDLAGKYRRFEALVGIDPDSKVLGRATLRILIDGKPQALPDIANLKAGNAVGIRVNISGARELVLVTDFGAAGGVGADVNWCDARLVE